ncbi:Ni/Fe hydrogenase subunit alpha [Geobacter sp. AOG2]|uniref:Ni/Fe hydrogenase subunit alpha n=1 Tax=Geobacter sp. AOG2 TaxID=1566347 RepID=UPI001CC346D5|nr:Ni/Fe hydrogenase subunit alpha [Geobacter sp. AOG2]GFE61838.1 hydrogenase [Geobacter sp. AOG2]
MNRVLEIRPLTRVEGHGRIEVRFAGTKAEMVSLSFFEAPRFFEALLKGKSYEEVPEIICRICSLCSTVHRICSLFAIEKALDIRVSEQVGLYRELILHGGHIQSHALHLFCLVLPDCFAVDGISGLADKAPQELKRGLHIKAAGNLIQEIVGGRTIHPVTLVPGGMGKPVSREGLLKLKETLQGVLPETRRAFELFRSFLPNGEKLDTPRYLSVHPEGASPFFGDSLTMGNAETIPVELYTNLLREKMPETGNAKAVLVNEEPATVGALARLNLGMNLTPMAAAAFEECRMLVTDADIRANNLAQAVELILAVERSLEIVDILIEADFSREETTGIVPKKGQGIAAVEAPRGVLIHNYSFDDRGICRGADIVTPTVINQAAMERDLIALATHMEGADDEELTGAFERLVRAYDPCISCAVHLLRI